MTAQLALGDEQKPCEWCGAAPAARAVIGTLACLGCAAATARDRVIAALRRWSRR